MAEAPQSVLKLVERFELHRDAYRRGRYGEAEVRVELIDDIYCGICPQNPQNAYGPDSPLLHSSPVVTRHGSPLSPLVRVPTIAPQGIENGTAVPGSWPVRMRA